jgi:hypothetical protein
MVEEARARLGDVGAFQLEPFFGEIEVEWYPDSLEISEAEPLAAYVRSLGAADDDVADVLARGGSGDRTHRQLSRDEVRRLIPLPETLTKMC